MTSGDLIPLYGVCSATGIVGLVGMVVLLVSVSFFEDSFVHNPPFRIKISWGNEDIAAHEFEAALQQISSALDANTRCLESNSKGPGGGGGLRGSSELIPLALSVLRDELEMEAAARQDRFSHAVLCLNIPSTQYRALCFFEAAGLLAAFILFASAEALKSTGPAHGSVLCSAKSGGAVFRERAEGMASESALARRLTAPWLL